MFEASNSKKRSATSRRVRQEGHAVVEGALMVPWILLLFLLVFDFGYYAYSAAATANAARAAALATARSWGGAGNDALACQLAANELRMMWNVAEFPPSCDDYPLIVTATAIDVGACPSDPTGRCSRVSVEYRTPQFFALPWLFGQMTLTQESTVRVYRQ